MEQNELLKSELRKNMINHVLSPGIQFSIDMIDKLNLSRTPTLPVEVKTAEEILSQFNGGGQNRYWKNTVLEAMEAYHAQYTQSSDKTVEVEEEKSEKLPEYKFRKFKITGITPDAYVELNNEEIKNINGMIPCLASRLIDYPYMFVMPDGKSCHSDWLLFETFESEKQGKEVELMEALQKILRTPSKSDCDLLAIEALKTK